MARARTLTLKTQVEVKGADKLNDLGRSMQRFGTKLSVGVTLPLGLLANAARGAASDLNESLNAIRVTYGEHADAVTKIGEGAAESLGLSQRAFNQAATQFSAFAFQIAGEGGNVAGVLEELTTRAADFASVHNIEVADALQLFQSGLAGETEPLRRFGADLSAAAVEAHAIATGIADGTGALTEAQKVQARYSLLLEQTSKVAGDFANTQDEAANATRIAQARMEDASAALGQRFLPIQEKIIGVVNSLIDAWEKLPAPVQDAVIAFGAVAAALGPLLIVFGTLARSVGTLIRIVPALSGAFTALGTSATGLLGAFGPLGIVMAAFAADVGGAKTTFNTIEDFKAEATAKGWDILTTAIGRMIGTIEEELPKAPKTADVEFKNFTTTIHNHMLAAKGIVDQGAEDIAGVAGDLPGMMADELLANQFSLTDAVTELTNFAEEALSPIQEKFQLQSFLASQELANHLTDNNPLVRKKAEEMQAAAINRLAELRSEFFTAGYNMGNSFGGGMAAAAQDPALLNWISDSAARLAAAARGIFPSSEPKDPNSPLRGITKAFGFGEVLAQGILSGRDAVARAARTVAGVGFGVPAMATAGAVPIGGTGATTVNNYFTFNGTSAGGPNELSDTLRRLSALSDGQVRYG